MSVVVTDCCTTLIDTDYEVERIAQWEPEVWCTDCHPVDEDGVLIDGEGSGTVLSPA